MTAIHRRRRFMRIPVTAPWGVRIAFATAAISGIAIWLNGYAIKQVPDAAVYTTLKNAVAALVLILAAGASGGAAEVRRLDRATWAKLLVVGVIGGSIPFLLFFEGLAHATAPGAAFIHKTLFVWVAVLAVPFLRERLGWAQITAMAVLLGGLVLLAPPKVGGATWSGGETMIALATLSWAVEVIVVKRLLGTVSPPLVGAARLGLGLILLVGYLGVTGSLGSIGAVSAVGWAWVLVTGLLLAAYVATWFAALRRAPASLVASVLVAGAVVTPALQAISDGRLGDPTTVLGGIVVVGAAVVACRAALGRDAVAIPRQGLPG